MPFIDGKYHPHPTLERRVVELLFALKATSIAVIADGKATEAYVITKRDDYGYAVSHVARHTPYSETSYGLTFTEAWDLATRKVLDSR